MSEIIHSLKPRKPGKWNPYITLCNKNIAYYRATSKNLDEITCPCCNKRRAELLKQEDSK